MKAVGLEEMETYISRRQNIFTQYIANRHIVYLCLEAERRPGLRVAGVEEVVGE